MTKLELTPVKTSKIDWPQAVRYLIFFSMVWKLWLFHYNKMLAINTRCTANRNIFGKWNNFVKLEVEQTQKFHSKLWIQPFQICCCHYLRCWCGLPVAGPNIGPRRHFTERENHIVNYWIEFLNLILSNNWCFILMFLIVIKA